MPKNKKLIETIKDLSTYKTDVQIVFTSPEAAQAFWNDLAEVEEDCKKEDDGKLIYQRIYDALLEGEVTYWNKFSSESTVQQVLLNHVENITKLTTLKNVGDVSDPTWNYFDNKCKSLPSGNYCIGFENNKFSVWKRIPYKKLKAMWDKE